MGETPAPLRHMYGMGITLKVGRAQARVMLPGRTRPPEGWSFSPEPVLTGHVAFDDADEAIKDPTIKVVLLRDGVK